MDPATATDTSTAPSAEDRSPRATMIVNPYSSGMTARRERQVVLLLREHLDLTVLRTERPNHAQDLTREAIDSGAEVVIACGGDGTANEVTCGLDPAAGTATERPALAVLPGGATNVLARGIGLPNDPVKAARQLAAAIVERRWSEFTIGKVDERAFLFCAGIGLDAETVKRKETQRRGRRSSDLAYLAAGVTQFVTTGGRIPAGMTIRADDGDEFRAACLFCGNLDPYTYLGKIPVHLMPAARPDNGLSVVAPETLPVSLALREASIVLSRQARRKRFNDRRHDLTDVSTLHVSCDMPMAVQADGEYLGDRSRITLRALPAALRIVG